MKPNPSQVGKRSSSQAAKPQSPKSAAQPLVCMACSDKAATLHLNQITGEKLIKLDLCDGCANMFWRFAPTAAPTPPPMKDPALGSLPAAPGINYNKMVAARTVAMDRETGGLGSAFWINLPGLIYGWQTMRVLFERMLCGVYFNADAIRRGLSPQLGSAWELVELEELLCIGNGVVGDNGEKLPDDSKAPVKLWMRESLNLLGDVNLNEQQVAAFTAFTLHYHATAICDHVLPALNLADAVSLAEALVIAEAMVEVSTRSERASGTGPSPLQQRACELTARLWREWPDGLSFNRLLPSKSPEPSYFEQISGAAASTAAAASTESKAAA